MVGARRTAEELGRAFPGVPVWTSGRDVVLATVPDQAGVAVSTPGAEPVPEGPGYGAVLLLDTWALLTRADLLTVRERKGELAGLTVAFVGDGACNMGNSWLLAGATAGLHVRIAAPEGHQPEGQYVDRARDMGQQTGPPATVLSDPREAVTGADVVVTDTWVSMGREDEAAARLAAFTDYTVTAELMSRAAPDAIVMHCLPAYRGKEIDADVLDGPQSVVWDEAENRRHAQKAIITWLLRDTTDLEEGLS